MAAAPRAASCAARTRRPASPDESRIRLAALELPDLALGAPKPGRRSFRYRHQAGLIESMIGENRYQSRGACRRRGSQPRTCSRELPPRPRDEPVGHEDGCDAAALTPPYPGVSHMRSKNGREESVMRVTSRRRIVSSGVLALPGAAGHAWRAGARRRARTCAGRQPGTLSDPDDGTGRRSS